MAAKKSDEEPTCIVCCEPITCFAVGACGHKDLCATCVYRRRRLSAQCICAICKDPLDIVLFTHDAATPFPATDRALADVLRRPGVAFIPDPPDQARLFRQNVEDYTRTAAEHAAAAAEHAARAAALAEANARRAAELARLCPHPRPPASASSAFPALPAAPPSAASANAFPALPSAQKTTTKKKKNKNKKGGATGAGMDATTTGATGATTKTSTTENGASKEGAHEEKHERLSHEPGVVCMEAAIGARIRALSEYRCPVCAARPQFATLEELKAHLHEAHQLYYCDICLAERKVFLEEQVLMRASELALHMTQWDGGISASLQKMLDEQEQRDTAHGRGKGKGAAGAGGAGGGTEESKRALLKWRPMLRTMATGHPLCRFCNTRFYGGDQLYDHLIHAHILCPICEKRGDPWQFFRDMKELVAHYDRKHYLCHYPGCLMGFPTSLDLKIHQGTEHGVNVATSGTHGGKLVLETHFTVRRAARNGEGIVDDDEYHFGTLMDPEQYREAQHQQRLRAAQARAHSPASQALANMRALAPPPTTDFFAQHQSPSPSPQPLPQQQQQQQQKGKNKKNKKAAQKAATAAATVSSAEEASEVDVARPVATAAEPVTHPEGAEDEAPVGGHRRLAIERPHPAAALHQPEPSVNKDSDKKVDEEKTDAKKTEEVTTTAKTKAETPKATTEKAASPQPQAQATTKTTKGKAAEPAKAATATTVTDTGAGGFCNTEGMSVQEKNQLMVTVMKSLVSEAAFKEFKEYSAKYRAGAITGKDYYARFFATFGASPQTRELFSLLASLLPDPEKRMELLELHTVHSAPPSAPRPAPAAAPGGAAARRKKGKGPKPAGVREAVPGFGKGEYRLINEAEGSDFPSLAQGVRAAQGRGKRGKQVLFHMG